MANRAVVLYLFWQTLCHAAGNPGREGRILHDPVEPWVTGDFWLASLYPPRGEASRHPWTGPEPLSAEIHACPRQGSPPVDCQPLILVCIGESASELSVAALLGDKLGPSK
jgi:hypothetical protein